MRKLVVLVLLVVALSGWCRAAEPVVVFEETFSSTKGWGTDHGGTVEVVDHKGVFGGGADKEGTIFTVAPIRVDLDEGLTFEVVVSEVEPGAQWRIMMGAGEGWWSAPNFHVDTWRPSTEPEERSVDITALAAEVGLSGPQDLWIVFWVKDGRITVEQLRLISREPKPVASKDPELVFEQDFVSSLGVSAYDGAEYRVEQQKGIMKNSSMDPAYVVFGPVLVDLDEELTLDYSIVHITPGAMWNLNIGYKEQWWQGPHLRPYGTDMIFSLRSGPVNLSTLARKEGLAGEQRLYFVFDVRNGEITIDSFRILKNQ